VSATRDQALDQVIEHIGFLMNSLDPYAEITKLISLELTVNPDSAEMSYEEIFAMVVGKLMHFYQDKELEEKWTHFVILSGQEELEEEFAELERENEEEDDDDLDEAA